MRPVRSQRPDAQSASEEHGVRSSAQRPWNWTLMLPRISTFGVVKASIALSETTNAPAMTHVSAVDVAPSQSASPVSAPPLVAASTNPRTASSQRRVIASACGLLPQSAPLREADATRRRRLLTEWSVDRKRETALQFTYRLCQGGRYAEPLAVRGPPAGATADRVRARRRAPRSSYRDTRRQVAPLPRSARLLSVAHRRGELGVHT